MIKARQATGLRLAATAAFVLLVAVSLLSAVVAGGLLRAGRKLVAPFMEASSLHRRPARTLR